MNPKALKKSLTETTVRLLNNPGMRHSQKITSAENEFTKCTMNNYKPCEETLNHEGKSVTQWKEELRVEQPKED